MGVINKCCEMAGIERLTPDNVDLEDENMIPYKHDNNEGDDRE